MTQQDLVVLCLAEHREWRRAYELERQMVGKEMIGSEADTRLYELFNKETPDLGFTTREIKGDTYTIETKKQRGERWWRAYLTSRKPIEVKKMVRHPLTGEMITTEQYQKLT